MSQTAQQTLPEPVTQWVTFQLDAEVYGIRVMQVQEVVRVPDIAPVPGAPDYVLGIINLRGNVVTVIDTRRRFGLPSRGHDDATRIVIVEARGHVVGLLVDNVAEVVELRASQIESAPNVGNERTSRFIEGVHSQDNELLILVDVDRLLSEQEWQEVSAL